MKSHAAQIRDKKISAQAEMEQKAAAEREAKHKAAEQKAAKRRAAELGTLSSADMATKKDVAPSSPARRHLQKVEAANAAGASPAGKPQTGDQYELMAATLWEARRTLKGIKSVEGKIDKKRELLPQFDAYVDGVLQKGQGAQDDVLMTFMVWSFDIADLVRALDVAEYALKHGLQTPDHYERDTASIVAEQAAEEGLKMLDREDVNLTTLLDCLQRAEAITTNADMHDQIRAKLHKALGYALREGGNLEAALKHLQRALELNDRVGVKKDIEKLERDIKNARDQENT